MAEISRVKDNFVEERLIVIAETAASGSTREMRNAVIELDRVNYGIDCVIVSRNWRVCDLWKCKSTD